METVHETVLTDDEVAAIAGRRMMVWPTSLRTIDASDPRALADAMTRGLRSLAGRGLLAGEGRGVLDPQLDELGEAVSGGPIMTAFMATVADPADLAGRQVAAYEFSGDKVLVELVRGLGSHNFGIVTRSELREVVDRLVISELDRQQTGTTAEPALALYVVGHVAPGSEVLVVAGGTARSGRVNASGGVDGSEPVDSSGFISRLLP